MAEMVLAKHQLGRIGKIGIDLGQLAAQQTLLEQLLADPYRQRGEERFETAGREGEVGVEQTLEFQEGLVVEDDVIDVLTRDPRILKAPSNRVCGKRCIGLLAGEALFLRGGNHLPVTYQGRRTVVVVSGETENEQQMSPLEDRVDERRDGRSLSQHDQPAEHEYQQENGHQPEFLALPKEFPDLSQKRHAST